MRVLLVDDHAPIRRGLRQLLELKEEFEVVGEGANGQEAIERVEQLSPDIVLMDMNMPVMSGIEATRLIKAKYPQVMVLALTAFGDMSLVSAMVKAGASGYLLKGGSSEELISSLEAVAKGKGALDKEVTRGVMDDLAELYHKEQERADALAELDRMKSEFVSVVSHELRTPLTSIKGAVTTLERGWDAVGEETKHEFLQSISKQCDKLTRLVSQILTVSGIQRGGVGLSPSVFPLNDLIAEALSLLEHRADGRIVHLQLTQVQACGDRGRLLEVAISIIENALQFTDGYVVVQAIEEGGIPKLHVRDEGPGIDEETLKRLLVSPFSQGDSSMTREHGGLGLSLYIARQVLEASGGRLEIESGSDRGSTFTMVMAPADALEDALV